MCAPSTIAALALASCITAPLAHASGPVEVRWLQSDTYSDAGRSVIDREQAMRSLGEYMAGLGRLLPDGQSLQLEVTDLDLAGEIEPVGWHDLRVLRGRADWPRLSLRFTLSAAGLRLKRGEAQLSDMAYMFGVRLSLRQETLGYEKRMIERWFKAEFAAP